MKLEDLLVDSEYATEENILLKITSEKISLLRSNSNKINGSIIQGMKSVWISESFPSRIVSKDTWANTITFKYILEMIVNLK